MKPPGVEADSAEAFRIYKRLPMGFKRADVSELSDWHWRDVDRIIKAWRKANLIRKASKYAKSYYKMKQPNEL